MAKARTSSSRAPRHPGHVVIVGAGAAGLMAARELGRAGKTVTILEARDRCGGRIDPLPRAQFGYPAEGGAEFVHGAAPVTRALLGEAQLPLSPLQGTRWTARDGPLARDDSPMPHADRLYQALANLEADLTVAEFLERDFAGDQYGALRRVITRMVEGYDAADPARASTLALRDEWMGRGLGTQARIVGGYGALIEFLAAECRRQGAAIRLGAAVRAVEVTGGRVVARCDDGDAHAGDAVILAVPLPLLTDIALPQPARDKAAAAVEHIGFGNVIKILLRFATDWWAHAGGRDLTDLSFLLASTRVPTWWTQCPARDPVLTGWFAGPKSERLAQLDEAALVDLGLASLAEIFGMPVDHLTRELVAARAINWANDPFARGAYSYATPDTRAAQSVLASPDGGMVFFSGEALYRGPDMGTVEAALASGLETARTVLAATQRVRRRGGTA
jgi:monoamine oxidase